MAAGTRMAAGPVSGPSGPSGLLPGLLFNPLSDLLPACFPPASRLFPDLLFNRLSGRQSRLSE